MPYPRLDIFPRPSDHRSQSQPKKPKLEPFEKPWRSSTSTINFSKQFVFIEPHPFAHDREEIWVQDGEQIVTKDVIQFAQRHVQAFAHAGHLVESFLVVFDVEKKIGEEDAGFFFGVGEKGGWRCGGGGHCSISIFFLFFYCCDYSSWVDGCVKEAESCEVE